MKRWKWLILGLLLVGVGSSVLLWTNPGRQAQFLLGGALVNMGYGLQDPIDSYDFNHHDDISPDDIWNEMTKQNLLASFVRSKFPRTTHHPLVALVVCMDARIDTSELTGDTRKYYYIIRTAGSVLSEKEEEMLELAVQNGVKLVVWTTHTDCAAERVASTESQRKRFPALAKAVDEREARLAEFLARPMIASRRREGKLKVVEVNIDTENDRIVSPVSFVHRAPNIATGH